MATSRASDAERMFDLHEDDIALVTLAMDGPVHPRSLSTVLKTGIPANHPVQLWKADSQVGVLVVPEAGDGAWQRAVIAR